MNGFTDVSVITVLCRGNAVWASGEISAVIPQVATEAIHLWATATAAGRHTCLTELSVIRVNCG